MTARIKNTELAQLHYLSRVNIPLFYMRLGEIMKAHGCTVHSHTLTPDGWIVKRI